MLRYKGKMVIGTEGGVRKKIIIAIHDSQLGGHFGIQASYQMAQPWFHWPGMHKDIKETVLQCDTFRKCKDEHTAYPGLLQPLTVPQYSWSHVTMDFIEELPVSKRRDTIMVVVDRFTKSAHFISLSHPFDAPTVARIFLDQICKLHRVPLSMLSDRDKVFTSHFWIELFTLLWTDLKLSTAYHPQIDGQSKRVNQVLEMYLRYMTYLETKRWNAWLSLAEW